MADDERTFVILPQHAHLVNGNALTLKDPYLSLLRNKLSEKQYSVDIDRERDRNDSFWILHGDERVAHMFLGKGQGIPDVLALMAVPHFEEHLDSITSLVQDWFNNTPAQGGGSLRVRRRRKTRRRNSKKAQRKH